MPELHLHLKRKLLNDLICEQLSVVSDTCRPAEFERNNNTERRMKKGFDYLNVKEFSFVRSFISSA